MTTATGVLYFTSAVVGLCFNGWVAVQFCNYNCCSTKSSTATGAAASNTPSSPKLAPPPTKHKKSFVSESGSSESSRSSSSSIRAPSILRRSENLALFMIIVSILIIIFSLCQEITNQFIPAFQITGQILLSVLILALMTFYVVRMILSFQNSRFGISNITIAAIYLLEIIYVVLSITYYVINYTDAAADIERDGETYYLSLSVFNTLLGIYICLSIIFCIISVVVIYIFNLNLLRMLTRVRREAVSSVNAQLDINLANALSPKFNPHETPGGPNTDDGSGSENSVSTSDSDSGTKKGRGHGVSVSVNVAELRKGSQAIPFKEGEKKLLYQITKQTLLVTSSLGSAVIFWIINVIYEFSLVATDDKTNQHLRFSQGIFENIFYLVLALSLLLSFGKNKNKYEKICKICHKMCQNCCESMVHYHVDKTDEKNLVDVPYNLMKDQHAIKSAK